MAAARRAQCINNLKQMGLATHNLHDTYKHFPPALGLFPSGTLNLGPITFYLLPYIDQGPLWQQALSNGTYVSNNNNVQAPRQIQLGVKITF